MLTLKLKHFVPAAIVLVLILGIATIAHANPFYVGYSAKTATATSTQAYLTTGTAATSTVIYDSYEQFGTNQTNSANLTLPNTVAVLLNGVASSTSSVVTVICEYSDNYNGTTGNGDWYQNELLPATSTIPVGIGAPMAYSFVFAPATVGGILLPNNRFQKVVTCPVPLRFVRTVVSVTGANASIYTAIIPTKQRNAQ